VPASRSEFLLFANFVPLIGGVGEINVHNVPAKKGVSRTAVVDFASFLSFINQKGGWHPRHRSTEIENCLALLSLMSDSYTIYFFF